MSRIDLSALMRPRSIAVLGASTDPAKFSNRPLVYLRRLGFRGPVYPVHPQAGEIEGFRCWRSLDDLPQVPDVVVVARPAEHVPGEVRRCIELGVRAFVVFGAGFAESGPEGAALQQRLQQLCREAGAVLCGPNGTGVIDAPSGAALSFMSNLDREVRPGGSVALVSGSGSIAAMLFQTRGHVFRSVASIGNEAVTTAADFIADAVEQHDVAGVVAFVESIRDPAGFMAALRRAGELGKPVALLKGGRTARSAQVAATHTGAMVDDDVVTQAMLEHCNAIRASSIAELKLLAELIHASATRSLGPGIGVLTPSGGTAVLIVDDIIASGLELPAPGEATCAALKCLVPEATPGNPMDITGFGANSKAIFANAMQTLLDDPAIDVLLVPTGGGVGEVGERRAEALIDAAGRSRKLLVPIWQGTTRDQRGYEALREAGLPVMTDETLLVTALGKLARRRAKGVSATSAEASAAPPAEVLRLIAEAKGPALSEPRVKAVLQAAGIEVPASRRLPPDADASVDLPWSGPSVLKVASPDLLHKSAVGGVAMLHDAAELLPRLRRMRGEVAARCPEARLEGWLVEQAAPGGLDLLAGIQRDARYGPVLTLAMGGTWANSLRGAVAAMLPLSPGAARALVARFLAEGSDPAAREVLVAFLLRLAGVALALGERLQVLEVNPVRLCDGPQPRAVALDGVLTLTSE